MLILYHPEHEGLRHLKIGELSMLHSRISQTVCFLVQTWRGLGQILATPEMRHRRRCGGTSPFTTRPPSPASQSSITSVVQPEKEKSTGKHPRHRLLLSTSTRRMLLRPQYHQRMATSDLELSPPGELFRKSLKSLHKHVSISSWSNRQHGLTLADMAP